MDKFAFVFEFNNNSPLIVYKAAKELADNNIAEAIDLLNKAIDNFPYYPTPHYLLALALAHNEEFEKAKLMLSKAHNLLDCEETYKYYTNEIEQIKKKIKELGNNFDDTVNKVLNETLSESDEENNLLPSSENPLENQNDQKTILPEGTIITETLAEIYSSQGNYNEAIEIYQKLKNIQPQKAEKYEKRISELNNLLSTKN